MIENDVPDYLVEKEDLLFAVDPKAKTSQKKFGWANSRAVKSYRIVVKSCEIPIYLVFVLIENKAVKLGIYGHSDVMQEPINKIYAWDGNLVFEFSYEIGLPHYTYEKRKRTGTLLDWVKKEEHA